MLESFYFNSILQKNKLRLTEVGSLLKFTQTTNGALSPFQYTRKANPTGNKEN